MLDTLAAVEPFTWASVLSKMLLYLSSAIAAGAVIFLQLFNPTAATQRTAIRRLALWSASAAVLLSVLLIDLRAAFLGGATLEAALDTGLIRLVLDSRLGTANLIRLSGLGLILTLVVDRRASRLLALTGVLLVASSFTFVGHSLNAPRAILAALLTLHVLAAAFWIGALGPLYHIVRTGSPEQAGTVARRFGQVAVWVVGTLVIAGVTLAAFLIGGIRPLLTTDYGQLLFMKITLVAGLAAVAAYNRFALSPALASGSAPAARRLLSTIRLEWVVVVVVLFVTATFTSITAPS